MAYPPLSPSLTTVNRRNAKILRFLDLHDYDRDGRIVATTMRGILVDGVQGVIVLGSVRAAREWLGYGDGAEIATDVGPYVVGDRLVMAAPWS